MAPSNIADIDFALACLKHSAAKPDFEKVALELGLTKNAAYHRHYGMMRKLAAGDIGAGSADPATTPTADTSSVPPTPKKRGRKSKDLDLDAIEDDEDVVESPSKKIKAKGKGKAKSKAKKAENDDDEVLQAHVEVTKIDSEEEINE